METKRIMAPEWWRSPELEELDRRTRKSYEALFGALAGLLRTKPLREITVTELTRAADVNRSTFYAHFHDIGELFERMRRDSQLAIRRLVADQGDNLRRGCYRPMLQLVYDYFGQNHETLDVMGLNVDGAGPAVDVAGVLMECYLEAMGETDADTHRQDGESRLISQGISFCINGTAGMIGTWLAQGCQESAETMADRNARLIEAISATSPNKVGRTLALLRTVRHLERP